MRDAELWARWSGKFHRVCWNGNQRPDVRGWHFASWCGAWEQLASANVHHLRRVRAVMKIKDVPRVSERCLNCTSKPVSRNSQWPKRGGTLGDR